MSEALCLDQPLPAKPANSGQGFVHSHSLGSFVDGPGLRLVYWLSGCALRCLYCHNPDTWRRRQGKLVTLDEALAEVLRYRRMLRIGSGGLTLSGGEPLVQAPFALELLRRSHELGVHTALDTNGFLGRRVADADFESIDLVLLDLKAWSDDTHRRLTGQGNGPVRAFAERLAAQGRKVWVRFVLVPGHSDSESELVELARYTSSLGNVERVDVLPFHQMGRPKWRELGRPYALEHVEPPSDDQLRRVRGIFSAQGLSVAGE